MGLSNASRRFLASCTNLVRQAIAPQCLLCSAHARGELLCAGCRRELPRLQAPCCIQCALPLAQAGMRCGACLAHAPAFDQVLAPWTYDFPADALVTGLKYRGLLAVAPLLGEAIAGCISGSPGERPDVLVPMPLSAARLRQRGFNQAQEIARHAARACGLPLLPHACRRVRDTPPQAALPWKERARNMRRAFVCDEDFSGKHVAVIDDVMTTGATLSEIARNLKQAGAVRVSGLVAARTLPGAFRGTARHV